MGKEGGRIEEVIVLGCLVGEISDGVGGHYIGDKNEEWENRVMRSEVTKTDDCMHNELQDFSFPFGRGIY